MKKGIVLACLAMFILFVAVGAYAENAATGKQVVVEKKQEPEMKVDDLQDIKNPAAGFKVDLWVDREDATYKVGDEVAFFFKTNKDCRVTLFNVGTSGKVHIFFPNKYQEDNLVKAGEEYRFPPDEAKYLFRLKGPAGIDLMKAIATIDDVPLLAAADVKPEGEVQKVDQPQSELAKDIEIALKPVETKRWSEAEMVLTVHE